MFSFIDIKARAFNSLYLKLSPHLMAIFVAFGLVILIFPDVIFHHSSISMVDLYNGGLYNFSVTKSVLEPSHRLPYHGFSDTGGAAFQSEPMIQFMKNVFYHFESPYWNPYSAAGSLGIETLVDQKFSLLTILVVLAGGSNFSFHVITLGLYIVALFFLYSVLAKYFNISRIGAIAACVVYMLNGYNVANLGSNVIQVYLYFPILLYTLCAFAATCTTKRYVALVLANIIVLSTTFFPTSSMVLITSYLLSLGYIFSLSPEKKMPVFSSLKIFCLQVTSIIFAALILSFIYLPIVESFSLLKVVEMYSKRIFYPANSTALLSLFTPKHFWESYTAIDTSIPIGNVVFHLGVVSSLVATAALTRWKFQQGMIIGVLLFIFSLSVGRIFDVFGIKHFVASIFFIGNVAEQYWCAAVALVFPILVAYGIDALRTRRKISVVTFSLYVTIVYCMYTLWRVFGFIEPYKSNRIIALTILGGILICSVVLFQVLKRCSSRNAINISLLMVLALIFFELTYYTNHNRYVRHDIFKQPSEEVSFLKDHSGLYRVANIGFYGLTPEYGAAYQIQQIESLNMNIFPSYNGLFQRNFLPDPGQRWGIFPTFHLLKDNPQLNLTLLNFLGVKYIVVPITFKNYIAFFNLHGFTAVFKTPWTIIFENKNVYPRIFTVSTLIETEKPLLPDLNKLSLRDIAFTSDPKLIELAVKMGIKTVAASKVTNNFNKVADSVVTIMSYHNAHIVAKAVLEKPAVVVLPDNWSPNWKASVNGYPAYIGLVNQSFRGIALPAGTSIIDMRYRPKTLSIAFVISFTSLIALIGLLFMRRRIDVWLKKI